MSSRLVDEVMEWNTPIIGAYLLWCFSSGFHDKHPNRMAPVVILHFISIAILTSQELSADISRKRPTLESFIRSFTEKGKSDVLACLSQRIISKRQYTLLAIDIAVSLGFLAWDTESATLHPRSAMQCKRTSCKTSAVMTNLGNKAKIVGEWFAGHEVPSITSYLGVVL